MVLNLQQACINVFGNTLKLIQLCRHPQSKEKDNLQIMNTENPLTVSTLLLVKSAVTQNIKDVILIEASTYSDIFLEFLSG